MMKNDNDDHTNHGGTMMGAEVQYTKTTSSSSSSRLWRHRTFCHHEEVVEEHDYHRDRDETHEDHYDGERDDHPADTAAFMATSTTTNPSPFLRQRSPASSVTEHNLHDDEDDDHHLLWENSPVQRPRSTTTIAIHSVVGDDHTTTTTSSSNHHSINSSHTAAVPMITSVTFPTTTTTSSRSNHVLTAPQRYGIIISISYIALWLSMINLVNFRPSLLHPHDGFGNHSKTTATAATMTQNKTTMTTTMLLLPEDQSQRRKYYRSLRKQALHWDMDHNVIPQVFIKSSSTTTTTITTATTLSDEEATKHAVGEESRKPLNHHPTPDHILTAYIENVDSNDLNQKPLLSPRRSAQRDSLRNISYPQVRSCRHLTEQFPIDNESPTNADAYLPWIHDIFPTHDGTSIQFVAQNKRRCASSKQQIQQMNPQVSLFQHVSVKRLNDTNHTTRYQLVSHEDADYDGIATRFICRFQPSQIETLSTFNFLYDWTSYRKRYTATFTEDGKDDHKAIHTSQLLFNVPYLFIYKKRFERDDQYKMIMRRCLWISSQYGHYLDGDHHPNISHRGIVNFKIRGIMIPYLIQSRNGENIIYYHSLKIPDESKISPSVNHPS